jgi:hypothetical protein
MATARKPFTPAIYRTEENGVYLIESASFPGEVYTTDIRSDMHPMCDCPAGQDGFARCTKSIVCKHVRMARNFQAELVAALNWADFWSDPLPERFTTVLPVPVPMVQPAALPIAA